MGGSGHITLKVTNILTLGENRIHRPGVPIVQHTVGYELSMKNDLQYSTVGMNRLGIDDPQHGRDVCFVGGKFKGCGGYYMEKVNIRNRRRTVGRYDGYQPQPPNECERRIWLSCHLFPGPCPQPVETICMSWLTGYSDC